MSTINRCVIIWLTLIVMYGVTSRSDSDEPRLSDRVSSHLELEEVESQETLRTLDELILDKAGSIFGNGYGPIPEVSEQCQTLLNSLGQSAANFTVCTLINARPITICKSCMAAYQQVVHIYSNITEINENECQNELLNRDRLMLVQTTYQFIASMWSQAQCTKCYHNTINGTFLCNDTIEFFSKLTAVVSCINSSKDIFHIAPVADKSKKDVCVKCSKVYIDLNELYDKLNTKYNNHLCMDIVDAMNITRHEWSSQFHCVEFFFKGWPVFVLSSIVGLITILFYITNRFITSARESELVLQKRMSFVQSHNMSHER